MARLIDFIQQHDQSGRLRHYTGNDANHILRLLADQPPLSVTSSGHSRKSHDSKLSPVASNDYDFDAVTESPPTEKPSIDVFRKAARSLHYVSIAILSFLLLEVELNNNNNNNNNSHNHKHDLHHF